MGAFSTLMCKHLFEAKWVLAMTSLPLFALGWFLSFDTARFFADPVRQERFKRFVELQNGVAAELPGTLQREIFIWMLPPIILLILVWAIGRGSIAVAGELERGTLDLTLSRPIRRTTYYLSHVTAALLGLMIIVAGLVAGHMIGNLVHKVPNSPPLQVWIRPWSNAVALGFAIFGYTIMASSLGVVRWRSMSFGAAVTVSAGLAQALANLDVLSPYKKPIENMSIFKRYSPLRAATTGEDLGFDLSVLFAVGAVCALIGLIIFTRRDLPSSAG